MLLLLLLLMSVLLQLLTIRKGEDLNDTEVFVSSSCCCSVTSLCSNSRICGLLRI